MSAQLPACKPRNIHSARRSVQHARCTAVRSRGSLKVDASRDYVKLGRSDLEVSRCGVGALAWGDPNQGFGSRFDEPAVQDIFNMAVDLGLNFFDSAEVRPATGPC